MTLISLQPLTKTCVIFRPGMSICGYKTEWSDIHRLVRFNEEKVVIFTEIEYQLFSLLVEYYSQRKKEVTYEDIALKVFGTSLYDYDGLLPLLRKRVSAIRKKIAQFDIDIISIPQRGYELRDFASLNLPYRRGYRAVNHSVLNKRRG